MKWLLILVIIVVFPAIIRAQNRYDIVIDELMADPTPQTGLPNNEWIELKNITNAPVNLQNWRIGDASGQSGPMPNFILQPDSFVIVCASNAVASLSSFGTVISVTSFPSLDNDGDQLFLKAANGTIIHALSYSLPWYGNELKKEGGWTLEMMDTKSPCEGIGNWKASIHAAGGTPGTKNSIDAINNDQTAPQLIRAYTTDNTTIILVFDEPVDSLKGATTSNYAISGGLTFASAVTLSPLFNTIQLKTSSALTTNTVYVISVENIADCKNNLIGAANKIRVGLPADPAIGEWIINEIVFNPRPNAYDYIEYYNNSNKIFDAAKLYIANRNGTGSVSSIKALSAAPVYIFPGDHLVVTEDPGNLALNYLVKNPDNVLAISSLPSFPDDGGTVVALNFQGSVVDEVNYKKGWHFKLIANDEGVALERIDPNRSSQDETNWHSAASTAGYGTPTYENSQYRQLPGTMAVMEISPKIFSPDNDGRDDIAFIRYKMDASGYIANIAIFDAAGRPVRNLVLNGILGVSGFWSWDGLDDKGKKLPVGSYILFTEIFNLQGRKERFKNVVVLAGTMK
jgi:hypothetical protein